MFSQFCKIFALWKHDDISMVSYQKGPTNHAYAWQIGPFWQDTLDVCYNIRFVVNAIILVIRKMLTWNSNTMDRAKNVANAGLEIFFISSTDFYYFTAPMGALYEAFANCVRVWNARLMPMNTAFRISLNGAH